MSIIIRLQNLPLTAKAADIREFFGDLKIPKGAVNIVGGPLGDAFIGFASDDDARLAMQLEGKVLHSSSIRLFLSSRREMESVISNAHAMAAAVFSAGTKQQSEIDVDINNDMSIQTNTTKSTNSITSVPPQQSPRMMRNEFVNVHSTWLSNFSREAKFEDSDDEKNRDNQSQNKVIPNKNDSKQSDLSLFSNMSNSAPVFCQFDKPPPAVNQRQSRLQQSVFTPEQQFSEVTPFKEPSQAMNMGESWKNRNYAVKSTYYPDKHMHNTQSYQSLSNALQNTCEPRLKLSQQNQQAYDSRCEYQEPHASISPNQSQRGQLLLTNSSSDKEAHAEEHSYEQVFEPFSRSILNSNVHFPPTSIPNNVVTKALMDPIVSQALASLPKADNSLPKSGVQSTENFDSAALLVTTTASIAVASNISYSGPLRATNVPDQNIFNFGKQSTSLRADTEVNSSAQTVKSSRNELASSDDELYVELTRINAELLRCPAALEKFLAPSVPLTLSSVKIIFDKSDQPQYALVRFGCSEDARRVLDRNGEKGIRIRSSSRHEFEEAIEHVHQTHENVVNRRRRGGRKRRVNSGRRSRSRSHSADEYQSGEDEMKYRRTRSSSRSPKRDGCGVPLRICIRLSNVPYRATYKDVEEYVRESRAKFERIRQVFREKQDYSDRWIVEVSTNRDLRCLKRFRGTIFRRPIDFELISVKEAETAYAISSTQKSMSKPRDTSPIFSSNDKCSTSADNSAPLPLKLLKQPRENGLYSNIPNQQLFTQMPSTSGGSDQIHPLLIGHQQSQGNSLIPPKITLEAKTEEELITRGDLPPAAFGAFSSTPAISNLGRSSHFYRPPHDFSGTNCNRRLNFVHRPPFFGGGVSSVNPFLQQHRFGRPPHRTLINGAPITTSSRGPYSFHSQHGTGNESRRADFVPQDPLAASIESLKPPLSNFQQKSIQLFKKDSQVTSSSKMMEGDVVDSGSCLLNTLLDKDCNTNKGLNENNIT